MRILVEAVGSLTSNFLIKAIKESGNVCIATDASITGVGKFLADEFYQVPLAIDDCYSDFVFDLVKKQNIDLVIPTLDDGLIKWAQMRDELDVNDVKIALSSTETLNICLDKWNIYQCFKTNGIPTPKTSLNKEYPLVKPRNGRGGSGVMITNEYVEMKDMISQEVLHGTEYTIDVFCNLKNEPIYIVPRVRLNVKEGKSTAGEVVYNEKIISWVIKICRDIKFVGAINIQCFVNENDIRFTEINPRFGGGTALGMAATENWVPLVVDTFVNYKSVIAKTEVQYGKKMGRYYEEVYYF